MSNKSISVYLDAMKRQKEEQKPPEQVQVGDAEKANRQIAKHLNRPIAETPLRQTSKSPDRQAPKRKTIHQGIDIFKDQLLTLSKIQFALWRRDDRKPTMRELILKALDEYIKKMKDELGEI